MQLSEMISSVIFQLAAALHIQLQYSSIIGTPIHNWGISPDQKWWERPGPAASWGGRRRVDRLQVMYPFTSSAIVGVTWFEDFETGVWGTYLPTLRPFATDHSSGKWNQSVARGPLGTILYYCCWCLCFRTISLTGNCSDKSRFSTRSQYG